MVIERETRRRPTGLSKARLAAGLIGLAAVVASVRLAPNWHWAAAGVVAEVGPGQAGIVGDSTGGQGGASQAAPSSGPVDTSTRYTFMTYAEAEAFAAKASVHLLAPHWLPAGFSGEPITVALASLPPEAVASLGLAQRVATTQRFVATDGQGVITIVQSLPPPLFDLFGTGQAEADSAPRLPDGTRIQYGEFPQGVILFWRERGDRRSVGIIGDAAAAARLTRDDWLRLAASLQ